MHRVKEMMVMMLQHCGQHIIKENQIIQLK